jgi:tRNA A37 threonylcarbamoyltransferase TsaD
LEQLLTEIKTLNTKVPAEKAPAVENMAKRADTLVTESKSATPDKEWYQLSFKGIKEAALAIGEAAKPVMDVAEKLSPLLLGL